MSRAPPPPRTAFGAEQEPAPGPGRAGRPPAERGHWALPAAATRGRPPPAASAGERRGLRHSSALGKPVLTRKQAGQGRG